MALKIAADLHTHTMVSDHAYSTILENAAYAKSIGLECIAMTDHAPAMVDGAHTWHFHNLGAIPDYLHGVRILRGIECDILADGSLDVADDELARLEFVLASVHWVLFGAYQGIEAQTEAYLSAIRNPYVDCIAHSGLAAYPYDYETVVLEAKKLGKLIEINEHSFESRAEGIENCKKIALLCKKHQTQISVNTDAHFAYQLGEVTRSEKMLEEIDFPKELIVNLSMESVNRYLKSRKERLK